MARLRAETGLADSQRNDPQQPVEVERLRENRREMGGLTALTLVISRLASRLPVGTEHDHRHEGGAISRRRTGCTSV